MVNTFSSACVCGECDAVGGLICVSALYLSCPLGSPRGWNRLLPRELVESLSLEVFESCGDVTLRDVVSGCGGMGWGWTW